MTVDAAVADGGDGQIELARFEDGQPIGGWLDVVELGVHLSIVFVEIGRGWLEIAIAFDGLRVSFGTDVFEDNEQVEADDEKAQEEVAADVDKVRRAIDVLGSTGSTRVAQGTQAIEQ